MFSRGKVSFKSQTHSHCVSSLGRCVNWRSECVLKIEIMFIPSNAVQIRIWFIGKEKEMNESREWNCGIRKGVK